MLASSAHVSYHAFHKNSIINFPLFSRVAKMESERSRIHLGSWRCPTANTTGLRLYDPS